MGSSRMMRSLPHINAEPMATRCFCPPDRPHRMPFGERCKVKIGHDLIGLSGDAGIRLVESDEQFLAHAVGEQLVVDILHD